jgi:hypothetical protein
MGNVLDCASPIDLPDDFGDEEIVCKIGATRLSKSVLWALNRAFYAQHGAASWTSGAVPSFMSTNAYIAKAYSRYVLGAVMDVWRENTIGSMDEILYFVEVGGGTGGLSYLILEALLRFERFLPVGPDGRLLIRYVVTDASQSIIETWKRHPLMKVLCDKAQGLGLLDYGVFNAETDSEVSSACRKLPQTTCATCASCFLRFFCKLAALELLQESKQTPLFLLAITWLTRCRMTLCACLVQVASAWQRLSSRHSGV